MLSDCWQPRTLGKQGGATGESSDWVELHSTEMAAGLNKTIEGFPIENVFRSLHQVSAHQSRRHSSLPAILSGVARRDCFDPLLTRRRHGTLPAPARHLEPSPSLLTNYYAQNRQTHDTKFLNPKNLLKTEKVLDQNKYGAHPFLPAFCHFSEEVW